mmetsp:Transcript_59777/g.142104  ORF Transcript_59777/g.142104 Transcript_59777/m.142104 type:complete len:180 (+) Transcript_59777:3-542(+)
MEMMMAGTEGMERMIQGVKVNERYIELLGKMQRFRDQGERMYALALNLMVQYKRQEAARWLKRMRDLGEELGFLGLECRAFQGLGQLANEEGRHEAAAELLRNALAAAPLDENENGISELNVLTDLLDTLFKLNAVDEAAPLLPRFEAAAKALSGRMGGHRCPFELISLYWSAKLHEVL